MAWLSAIGSLIGLANALVGWLQSRQQISAAQAELISAQLTGAMDEIKSAIKTRMDVDARVSGPDAADKLRRDKAGFFRD